MQGVSQEARVINAGNPGILVNRHVAVLLVRPLVARNQILDSPIFAIKTQDPCLGHFSNLDLAGVGGQQTS